MTGKGYKMKTIKILFVIIGILFVAFAGLYVYTEWFWQEWPPARIERITGVRVPNYKIIEYEKGEIHFNGDYEDTFTFEFKTMPSEEMFDEIDKMVATGNTGWKRDGNKYSFSAMWGNGFPAPKGEREEVDGMFSITIVRGKKEGTITCGAW